MEQPVTSSGISHTEIPISINATLPASNNMVLSTEKQPSKRAFGRFANDRFRFPFKVHRLGRQPNTLHDDADKVHGSHSDSQKGIVPSIFSRVKTKRPPTNRISIGGKKLDEIIDDLNDNPIEAEAFEEQKIAVKRQPKCVQRSRHFIVHMMEQPAFHYVIIALIIIDLIIVFVELVVSQLSLPCLTDDEMEQYNVTEQRLQCLLPPSPSVEAGESTLFYISLILISIFVVEIFSAFYAFGWRRYTKPLYFLDAVIVIVSFILEVYFHFGSVGKVGRAAAGLVVLRLWKIIRAIHAIAHSMALRNHMIVTEIKEAKELLNEEKLHAENTIHEQQIKIEQLTNLLGKADEPFTPEQNSVFRRSRATSLDSITF